MHFWIRNWIDGNFNIFWLYIECINIPQNVRCHWKAKNIQEIIFSTCYGYSNHPLRTKLLFHLPRAFPRWSSIYCENSSWLYIFSRIYNDKTLKYCRIHHENCGRCNPNIILTSLYIRDNRLESILHWWSYSLNISMAIIFTNPRISHIFGFLRKVWWS